jgi:hypothetical protein
METGQLSFINEKLKEENSGDRIITSGLYYKLITIVIDAASVILQIVASLTIVIDDAS